MAGVGAVKKIPDYMRERAEHMKYNPLVTTHTEQGLSTHYPELYEIEAIAEFLTTGKDEKPAVQKFKNQALRYMIWLYSKDSILNTKPQEALKDRKYKALDLAGFQLGPLTKKFQPHVITKLVELREPKFMRAVLAYLRYSQRSELWSEIIITEEQLYEAHALRFAPVDKGEKGMKQSIHKKVLATQCKELMIDIRQYWDEFWEDHTDLKKLGEDEVYMTIEDRARINTGV